MSVPRNKEPKLLVVTGRIPFTQDQKAALLQAASTMIVATLAEPGCAKYEFSLDIDDPHVLHLFEQWEDGEALDTHFATPHFAVFTDALLAAADGPADFDRYEVASSKPLFG